MKWLDVILTNNELERMRRKITIDGNGCWVWNGARIKYRGYGVFNFRGSTQMVHRLMYAHTFGKIPRDTMKQVLDHIVCNNRACCNPKHLVLTTQGKNALRGNSPPAINHRKTHCLRGHKLPTKPINKYEGRRCVICRRDDARERWKKKQFFN